MIRELYAPNYEERKRAALMRSGGRCENVIEGKRCPRRLGAFKISRARNAGFEHLHIHHVNDDPQNPDAELMVLCDSCHMKRHRQPGADGKVPPRKVGYQVISIHHLLSRLTSAGFCVQPTEECRFTWRVGTLQGEAADPLDALTMAMHWLSAEVRDLQEARAEAQHLTDRMIRTQQAEERRLCDAAIRQQCPQARRRNP